MDRVTTSTIGNQPESSSSPLRVSSMSLEGPDLDQVQLVVFGIILPAIVIFGSVGNLINIVVLTSRPMLSSTTNRYLTCLAVYDILHLTCLALYDILYLTCLAVYDILYLVFAFSLAFKHYPSVGSTRSYLLYRVHIGRPLTDTWSNTGVWLTVTFTVERYICVSHPLKVIVWCTVRRAKYVILTVCAFSALATMPEWFATTIQAEVDNATTTNGDSDNKAVWKVVNTEFANLPGYRLGYIYLNQALFTFLPLVILLVFNGLLVRSVMTAARERCALTSTAQRPSSKISMISASNTDLSHIGNAQASSDNRITVMLIGVSVVFLVCQVPQAVYVILSGSHPTSNMQRLVATILNLLVVINCSANFVLYSTMSTKFRRSFKILFCRYRRSSMAANSAITFTFDHSKARVSMTSIHASDQHLLGVTGADVQGPSPAVSPTLNRRMPRAGVAARCANALGKPK